MITVEKFVKMKKLHGKLAYFSEGEGEEWKPWKKEFGYPEKFHLLMFEDGVIWHPNSDDTNNIEGSDIF